MDDLDVDSNDNGKTNNEYHVDDEPMREGGFFFF